MYSPRKSRFSKLGAPAQHKALWEVKCTNIFVARNFKSQGLGFEAGSGQIFLTSDLNRIGLCNEQVKIEKILLPSLLTFLVFILRTVCFTK